MAFNQLSLEASSLDGQQSVMGIVLFCSSGEHLQALDRFLVIL